MQLLALDWRVTVELLDKGGLSHGDLRAKAGCSRNASFVPRWRRDSARHSVSADSDVGAQGASSRHAERPSAGSARNDISPSSSLPEYGSVGSLFDDEKILMSGFLDAMEGSKSSTRDEHTSAASTREMMRFVLGIMTAKDQGDVFTIEVKNDHEALNMQLAVVASRCVNIAFLVNAEPRRVSEPGNPPVAEEIDVAEILPAKIDILSGAHASADASDNEGPPESSNIQSFRALKANADGINMSLPDGDSKPQSDDIDNAVNILFAHKLKDLDENGE